VATKIILQGGGEHARVVLDCLLAAKANVIALFDPKYSDQLFGVPQRGVYDASFEPEALAIVAIGNNALRKKVAGLTKHKFTSTVHPTAILSSFVEYGKGCMILHGSIIQARTIIGDHVIVNTGAKVDHDCEIGDYVHIAPGAVLCGTVKVGEGTLIGAGSTILPGVKIGKWSTIGAGSVIIEDVPDRAVVAGNPGRVLRMNSKPIAVFGAGGLGREVMALLKALPEWKAVGYFDDGLEKGLNIGTHEVLGGKEELLQWTDRIAVVVAIGDPLVKKQLCEYLKPAQQLYFPTLIHPQALIMDSGCTIGAGSILTAGCIVTTNVKIGEHALVNLNATIGHDSIIGNYSSIMPGVNLAGAVEIGESVLIGSGANVLSEVKIGNGSVIGAGAVVNHNVGDHVTAVGVPARVMKRIS
jgi:sugar O-acyltransferase (sialic acid O-acetyltransferase NeuD family)